MATGRLPHLLFAVGGSWTESEINSLATFLTDRQSGLTMRTLAERYGISLSRVKRILRREAKLATALFFSGPRSQTRSWPGPGHRRPRRIVP